MNILEEFWYGNIEPAEYDISSSKEYTELLYGSDLFGSVQATPSVEVDI